MEKSACGMENERLRTILLRSYFAIYIFKKDNYILVERCHIFNTYIHTPHTYIIIIFTAVIQNETNIFFVVAPVLKRIDLLVLF